MKIKNILTMLTILTLSVSTSAFAEENSRDNKGWEIKEEKERMREMRMDDDKGGEWNMKKGERMFKEGKDWMASSTASGTATSTMWGKKEFKDFKEMRKEMKNEMKEDRREDKKMMGAMGGLNMILNNATATALLAAKLGISTTTLKAQIASGTKLETLFAGKVTKEDFMKIIASSTASGTLPFMKGAYEMKNKMEDNTRENNFFGKVKSFFGGLFNKQN